MSNNRSSPYVGLVPFMEEDADLFFGREAETRLIIANLFSSPLTILYGMSGVGKSSILRAGVIPQLNKRKGVLAVVFTDWETQPLFGLKMAVHEAALAKYGERLAPEWIAEPAQSLEGEAVRFRVGDGVPEPAGPPPDSRLPLDEYLAAWAARLDSRLMIILDQFEDYIRYQPTHSPFAPELALAIMQAGAPVSFIIAIREDSYAKLDRFEGSIPILFDNFLRLDHLDKEAARDAIEKPLEHYNAKHLHDGKPPYVIEPELVKTVLEQVKLGSVALGQARGKIGKLEDRHPHVDTVYLQLVMTRLWNEEVTANSHVLRRGTLDRLHGSRAIVRQHLDDVMKELSPEEQAIAARVFQYLVTPSGTKVAYPVNELASYDRMVDEAQLQIVLDKLSDKPSDKLSDKSSDTLRPGSNRILRVVAAGMFPDARYEIFHDALGQAILDWRGRYLREQERRRVQDDMELKRSAALIQLARQRRRTKWLMVGVGVLMLMSIVLGLLTWYAFKNRREADRAKAEAESQRDAAQTERARAQAALEALKGMDRTLRDIKAVLRVPGAGITYAAFSDDNRFVVTAHVDGRARLWDVSTGEKLRDLEPAHGKPVTCAVFSPDGRRVATASADTTARLWDAETGKLLAEMAGHTAPVNSIRFSANGQFLVTASDDRTARVWHVGQGQSWLVLNEHRDAVRMAEFSPDGQSIVTASRDGNARIWSVQSGLTTHILSGHTARVNSAHFSPSGRTIVTASEDRTARIWDAATGRPLNVMTGHTAGVNSAEFSFDGQRVVTGSDDMSARIWSVGNAKPLVVLRGHSGKVNTAEFSPDALRVVTASDDMTARTWNALQPDRNLLVEFPGHSGGVTAASFSSDNLMLLTVGEDAVRVWDTSKFGGITVAEVYVEPVSQHGTCPMTVRLSGRIEVAEGAGIITYQFVRGGKIYRDKVEVSGPETKFVIANARVSASDMRAAADSYYLEVLEPAGLKSQRAYFRVKCDPQPTQSPEPPPVPTETP